MRELWIILFATTCASALGAEQPAFQTLRYNEDWSFLRDPAQRATAGAGVVVMLPAPEEPTPVALAIE